MINVVKIFSFEAAHRLTNYVGDCANIHGHSYKVEMCFEAINSELDVNMLNEQNMVVDFKDIKRIMGEWIDKHLDHALLLNSDDEITPFIKELPVPVKLFIIEDSPTAEQLCKTLFEIADYNTIGSNIRPVWVKVYETETAFAFYSNKDIKT